MLVGGRVFRLLLRMFANKSKKDLTYNMFDGIIVKIMINVSLENYDG